MHDDEGWRAPSLLVCKPTRLACSDEEVSRSGVPPATSRKTLSRSHKRTIHGDPTKGTSRVVRGMWAAASCSQMVLLTETNGRRRASVS